MLNRFMRRVLPNVDALGSLSATDDVVAPVEARLVVPVYRRVSRRKEARVLEEWTGLDHFNRRINHFNRRR